MKVESKPVTAIAPYAKNPRRNERAVDAVASSLKQFGWKQPIVVDKDGVIVVGHTRYYAALKLGMDKVPVVVAKDLTEDQCRAYRIADNKTNEIAEWNVGLLSEELRSLSDAGWTDFTGLAFNTKEIDALLSPLAEQVFESTRPTLESATQSQASGSGEYIEEPLEDDKEPDYLNDDFGERSKEDYDEEARPENSIKTYTDNVTFSSTNWLGLPDLREDMLWDGDIRRVYIKDGDEGPNQLVVWSSVAVDERVTGKVVGFYADDERFDYAIWTKSASFVEKLDRLKPAALVVPDFSTAYMEPTAFNIWQTYRARFLARYWQEAGHKIVLNLHVSSPENWEWIFLGLPKRCKSAITQIRTTAGDDVLRQHKLKGIHEWCRRVETETIYIYGGEHREWVEPHLPKQGPSFVWMDSYHKARKDAKLF